MIPDRLKRKARRCGSGLITVMVLVSILVVLACANARTLHRLRTHIRLVERQQEQRLATPSPAPKGK